MLLLAKLLWMHDHATISNSGLTNPAFILMGDFLSYLHLECASIENEYLIPVSAPDPSSDHCQTTDGTLRLAHCDQVIAR